MQKVEDRPWYELGLASLWSAPEKKTPVAQAQSKTTTPNPSEGKAEDKQAQKPVSSTPKKEENKSTAKDAPKKDDKKPTDKKTQQARTAEEFRKAIDAIRAALGPARNRNGATGPTRRQGQGARSTPLTPAQRAQQEKQLREQLQRAFALQRAARDRALSPGVPFFTKVKERSIESYEEWRKELDKAIALWALLRSDFYLTTNTRRETVAFRHLSDTIAVLFFNHLPYVLKAQPKRSNGRQPSTPVPVVTPEATGVIASSLQTFNLLSGIERFRIVEDIIGLYQQEIRRRIVQQQSKFAKEVQDKQSIGKVLSAEERTWVYRTHWEPEFNDVHLRMKSFNEAFETQDPVDPTKVTRVDLRPYDHLEAAQGDSFQWGNSQQARTTYPPAAQLVNFYSRFLMPERESGRTSLRKAKQAFELPDVPSYQKWREYAQPALLQGSELATKKVNAFEWKWEPQGKRGKQMVSFLYWFEFLANQAKDPDSAIAAKWKELREKGCDRLCLFEKFESPAAFQKSPLFAQLVGLMDMADENAESVADDKTYPAFLLLLNWNLNRHGFRPTVDATQRATALTSAMAAGYLEDLVDVMGIDLRDFGTNAWRGPLHSLGEPKAWKGIADSQFVAMVGTKRLRMGQVAIPKPEVDNPDFGPNYSHRVLPVVDPMVFAQFKAEDGKAWKDKHHQDLNTILSRVTDGDRDDYALYSGMVSAATGMSGEYDVVEGDPLERSDLKIWKGQWKAYQFGRNIGFSEGSIDAILKRAKLENVKAERKDLVGDQDTRSGLLHVREAYVDFRQKVSQMLWKHRHEVKSVWDKNYYSLRGNSALLGAGWLFSAEVYDELQDMLQAFARTPYIDFQGTVPDIRQGPKSDWIYNAIEEAGKMAHSAWFGRLPDAEKERFRAINLIVHKVYTEEKQKIRARRAVDNVIDNVDRRLKKLCSVNFRNIHTVKQMEEAKDVFEETKISYFDGVLEFANLFHQDGEQNLTYRLLRAFASDQSKFRKFLHKYMEPAVHAFVMGSILYMMAGRSPAFGRMAMSRAPSRVAMGVLGMALGGYFIFDVFDGVINEHYVRAEENDEATFMGKLRALFDAGLGWILPRTGGSLEKLQQFKSIRDTQIVGAFPLLRSETVQSIVDQERALVDVQNDKWTWLMRIWMLGVGKNVLSPVWQQTVGKVLNRHTVMGRWSHRSRLIADLKRHNVHVDFNRLKNLSHKDFLKEVGELRLMLANQFRKEALHAAGVNVKTIDPHFKPYRSLKRKLFEAPFRFARWTWNGTVGRFAWVRKLQNNARQGYARWAKKRGWGPSTHNAEAEILYSNASVTETLKREVRKQIEKLSPELNLDPDTFLLLADEEIFQLLRPSTWTTNFLAKERKELYDYFMTLKEVHHQLRGVRPHITDTQFNLLFSGRGVMGAPTARHTNVLWMFTGLPRVLHPNIRNTLHVLRMERFQWAVTQPASYQQRLLDTFFRTFRSRTLDKKENGYFSDKLSKAAERVAELESLESFQMTEAEALEAMAKPDHPYHKYFDSELVAKRFEGGAYQQAGAEIDIEMAQIASEFQLLVSMTGLSERHLNSKFFEAIVNRRWKDMRKWIRKGAVPVEEVARVEEKPAERGKEESGPKKTVAEEKAPEGTPTPASSKTPTEPPPEGPGKQVAPVDNPAIAMRGKTLGEKLEITLDRKGLSGPARANEYRKLHEITHQIGRRELPGSVNRTRLRNRTLEFVELQGGLLMDEGGVVLKDQVEFLLSLELTSQSLAEGANRSLAAGFLEGGNASWRRAYDIAIACTRLAEWGSLEVPSTLATREKLIGWLESLNPRLGTKRLEVRADVQNLLSVGEEVLFIGDARRVFGYRDDRLTLLEHARNVHAFEAWAGRVAEYDTLLSEQLLRKIKTADAFVGQHYRFTQRGNAMTRDEFSQASTRVHRISESGGSPTSLVQEQVEGVIGHDAIQLSWDPKVGSLAKQIAARGANSASLRDAAANATTAAESKAYDIVYGLTMMEEVGISVGSISNRHLYELAELHSIRVGGQYQPASYFNKLTGNHFPKDAAGLRALLRPGVGELSPEMVEQAAQSLLRKMVGNSPAIQFARTRVVRARSELLAKIKSPTGSKPKPTPTLKLTSAQRKVLSDGLQSPEDILQLLGAKGNTPWKDILIQKEAFGANPDPRVQHALDWLKIGRDPLATEAMGLAQAHAGEFGGEVKHWIQEAFGNGGHLYHRLQVLREFRLKAWQRGVDNPEVWRAVDAFLRFEVAAQAQARLRLLHLEGRITDEQLVRIGRAWQKRCFEGGSFDAVFTEAEAVEILAPYYRKVGTKYELELRKGQGGMTPAEKEARRLQILEEWKETAVLFASDPMERQWIEVAHRSLKHKSNVNDPDSFFDVGFYGNNQGIGGVPMELWLDAEVGEVTELFTLALGIKNNSPQFQLMQSLFGRTGGDPIPFPSGLYAYRHPQTSRDAPYLEVFRRLQQQHHSAVELGDQRLANRLEEAILRLNQETLRVQQLTGDNTLPHFDPKAIRAELNGGDLDDAGLGRLFRELILKEEQKAAGSAAPKPSESRPPEPDAGGGRSQNPPTTKTKIP